MSADPPNVEATTSDSNQEEGLTVLCLLHEYTIAGLNDDLIVELGCLPGFAVSREHR